MPLPAFISGQVKWDMQAKPQLVIHYMWHEDISAIRSSVSHPGTLYFFFYISIQSLKRKKF